MPNGTFNPFALGANTLRQIGEQTNTLVSGLGGQVTQTASSLLRQVASGAPQLPGLPAIAGFAGPSSNNPGHNSNGNPNGNGALPSPAGIAALVKPLAQLEASVLPRGIPGPAMALISATRGLNGAPAPPVVEEAVTARIRADGSPAVPGLEGVNGAGSRRSIGIQLS